VPIYVAGLAREFNKMSDRPAKQMAVLRRQRAELERSVQRIGEAFAHGLDREALLDIVAETALAACEGESCRIVLSGRTAAQAEAGVIADGTVGEALRAAESVALQEGGEAEATREDLHALARRLTGIHDDDRRLGAMTIVRQGDPFDAGQRELFRYLAGQAAVSVENLDLHELVSEHAITYELTGLSNQRRLRELIGKEAARAERFSHELALLILDIDDFKQVNDTYTCRATKCCGRLGKSCSRSRGRWTSRRATAARSSSSRCPRPARSRVGGGGANPSPHRGGGDPARGRVRGDPRHGQPGGRVDAGGGAGHHQLDRRGGLGAVSAKSSGKNRSEQATANEQPSWWVAAQGPATERRT
jgi:Diguanylate cyclase, GGDEF domain